MAKRRAGQKKAAASAAKKTKAVPVKSPTSVDTTKKNITTTKKKSEDDVIAITDLEGSCLFISMWRYCRPPMCASVNGPCNPISFCRPITS